MTADMMVRSNIRRLGHLSTPEDCAIEDDEPLFAATREFAMEFGGPITRAFLQALPEVWQREHLVIDSALMWLPVGAWAGPLIFHRERYTESNEGAFNSANRETDVEHIFVILSPARLDVLIGDIPAHLADSSLKLLWLDSKDEAVLRDAALLTMLNHGELHQDTISSGEIIHCGSSTFIRHVPAVQAGFHLFIRATRNSRQPLVNGFRTIV